MDVQRVLDLREGEGRIAGLLVGHLFFTTAAAIILSAAKNGLFLSAYPARLIPHVIVASALVTAIFSVLFTGLIGRYDRRTLLETSGLVAAASLVLARAAFLADPRSAFVLYLWLSIVGGLVVALAWSTVADLLTGRQSRRLMPLLVAGTSVAGITAGFGVAPAAEALGTPNLLLAAGASILVGAVILRLAPREGTGLEAASGTFLQRVRRGAGVVRRHRLIALVAGGLVLSFVIATLVDYQFKVFLQESYDRDAITSLFGVLAGAVGVGTLIFQAVASRVLFRRYGLVAGPYAQAAMLGAAGLAVAATGWLTVLAVLRFVDETSRFTLQKTVEQVSLSPFPPDVRKPAFTLLGGVLKPLSQAATGLLLIGIAPILGVRGLAVLTAVTALGLLALFRKHPPLYRSALQEALARHTLDLGQAWNIPSVVDRNALEIIDRAVADGDTAVTLFAISILRHAPEPEARPRLAALLRHGVNEVRAEAAVALVEVAGRGGVAEDVDEVAAMLRSETAPDVVRPLLAVADRLPDPPTLVTPWLNHEEADVRRQALLALARFSARDDAFDARDRVESFLDSPRPEDRGAAVQAAAVLQDGRFLPRIYDAAQDGETRSDALAALAAFPKDGLPWIDRLLSDPDVDESRLRSDAAVLARSPTGAGLQRLLALAEERAAVRAVLPPLHEARRRGAMSAVPGARMRRILYSTVREGTRYGLLTRAMNRLRPGMARDFLRDELEGRQHRAAEGALAALALSYDPGRIDQVAPHLRSDSRAARSSALELLEEILRPDDRLIIVPFLESLQHPARLQEAATQVGLAGLDLRDPVAALRDDPDPWLRTCAAHVANEREPGAHAADKESGMLPLMEIVFFLKSSSLFRGLPGQELARIADLAGTVHLQEDELLFREGDPGDAFYMVVSGSVAVERGTRRIAALGPHEGLGEMALLDGEPRSASVRALGPVTLLRIDQASFEALVDRSPALAKGIYRSLSRRLRNTLRQVND